MFYFGDSVNTYAAIAGYASIILLIPSLLETGRKTGGTFGALSPAGRAWIWLVSITSAGLCYYGFAFKHYAPKEILQDVAPFIVVLSCAILGSSDAFWKTLLRDLLLFFLAGLVINLIAIKDIIGGFTTLDVQQRVTRETISYKTQLALAMWPLLLLTCRSRSATARLLVFIGMGFVFLQQVLYQKRIITVRIAVTVLIFLVVLPWVARHWKQPWGVQLENRIRLLFVTAFGLVTLGSLLFAGDLIMGQFAGLMNRFQGKGFERYEGGLFSVMTTENERFLEGIYLIRSFAPHEYLIGRGMGGYYDSPLIDIVSSEQLYRSLYLDDLGIFGRREMEVGFLMPFLKGGLLLTFAYYFGGIAVLLSWKRCFRDPLSTAAYFVVAINLVFIFQEGWFIMPGSFDLVIVGASLGRCLAKPRLEGSRPVRRAFARSRVASGEGRFRSAQPFAGRSS